MPEKTNQINGLNWNLNNELSARSMGASSGKEKEKMAYERLWAAVSKPFTSDGTAQATFQISDTTGFFVKQQISLLSNTQPLLPLEIKRIDPDGTIHVGLSGDINNRTPIAQYLVADAASVTAVEQKIPPIKVDEITQYEYERDPIKAKRVIPVDTRGRFFTSQNPFPVIDGSKFKYDDLDITTENANGDPLVINFYLSSVLVATYTFTYRANGNLQHLHKDFF